MIMTYNMYMQKFWAVLVSLLVAVSTFSGVQHHTSAESFAYTQIARQNYINKKYGFPPVKNEQRIVECILKYGERYCPTNYISIPDFQKLMVRTARRESHFKNTAYNSGTKARGLFQHLDRYWGYLLFYIDEGMLGKHICEKNVTNTVKYYYRICYSTEMGAIALASCIRLGGGVRGGLRIYGGWNTDGACPKKAKSYIDYITRIK